VNILILGSKGLLGSYLSEYLKKHFVIYRSSKKSGKYKVNLFDKGKLKSLFLKISPDVIINCTGATDTQKCIQNKEYARKGNCLTVKNIISTLNESKIKSHLIHISTDQVYSGKNKEKNLEHKINTTNNYSKSKYAGELEAKKYRKTTIVRTNFFGPCPGAKKKSFSEFVLNQTIAGKTVRLPKNIIFNPISLGVLSKVLLTIVKKKIIGTYRCR
jgi:dTDP-4-dehydrorhamnose reductase